MNEKCDGCLENSNHKFADCILDTCGCSCVEQLKQMPANTLEDEVSGSLPSYLVIKNDAIKDILSLGVDAAILEFNRIRKDEWLTKKKDKRFRKNK